MKIQPRQQLLESWRALARCSYSGGQWRWGGRDQRNSISDAEQLLCLMGPATAIPTFKLDVPDETAEDILAVLRGLGDSIEIPRLLTRVATEYFQTYVDDSGTPIFSGGSYFRAARGREPTEDERRYDVVDSYSVSVRLSLATIGFVQVFRRQITRDDLLREVEALGAMASQRLTAAIIGLLRSFAVNVFEIDSPDGRNLIRMVNQSRQSPRRVVEDLNRELQEIRAGLRDLSIGSGVVTDLDNENRLFECGWSWGVVQNAPAIKTEEDVGKQPDGTAQDAPYLYFTVVALDCIQALFSERTRILGLLNDEQQRLARALQLRWDYTQSYWSTIARFGQGRWPIEDLPWRTTDGVESDYLSLLVTSITVQDLSNRRTPEGEDVARVGMILGELAGRARITRRTMADDQAVSMHAPGFVIELVRGGAGDSSGGAMSWLLADFAPQLLKQTIRAAGLVSSATLRGDLIALADRVWTEHLNARRLKSGAASQLWDQTSALYGEPGEAPEVPSWYHTERVVSCLVDAAEFVASPPNRSREVTEVASDLLAEAVHLFDQELLNVSAEAGPAMGMALRTVAAMLQRAQDCIGERPSTSTALALEVLRELDRLRAAREKVTEAV